MKYFIFIEKFQNHIEEKELKDLARTLLNLEKSIIYRSGHYIKLDIRIIHDITKYILRKYLNELDTETQKEWGIIDLLYTDYRKFSLKKLTEQLHNSVWTSEYDKTNLIRLYNEGNNEVHYDPKKFYKVMGKSHENNYKAKDMYGIAMAIFHIYKWIGEVIFKIDLSDYDSNIEVFFDGSKSFDILPNKEQFLSLVNTTCPLCEEGKIVMPNNKTFTHGPYLKCNNDKCCAIVSTGMNFRRKTNISCDTIDCKDKEGNQSKYKDTFTHNQQRYKECTVCGHRELTNEEIQMDYWDSLEE